MQVSNLLSKCNPRMLKCHQLQVASPFSPHTRGVQEQRLGAITQTPYRLVLLCLPWGRHVGTLSNFEPCQWCSGCLRRVESQNTVCMALLEELQRTPNKVDLFATDFPFDPRLREILQSTILLCAKLFRTTMIYRYTIIPQRCAIGRSVKRNWWRTESEIWCMIHTITVAMSHNCAQLVGRCGVVGSTLAFGSTCRSCVRIRAPLIFIS